MVFTLTVSEKDGPSNSYSFDKSEVSIGRVKGNDIVLPKGNVSKRHSRIVVKDGKFIVVDLKSTNGTYVNGRKITSPQVLKGEDKVYVGDFIIEVFEGGAAPPPPSPLQGPSAIQEMAPSSGAMAPPPPAPNAMAPPPPSPMAPPPPAPSAMAPPPPSPMAPPPPSPMAPPPPSPMAPPPPSPMAPPPPSPMAPPPPAPSAMAPPPPSPMAPPPPSPMAPPPPSPMAPPAPAAPAPPEPNRMSQNAPAAPRGGRSLSGAPSRPMGGNRGGASRQSAAPPAPSRRSSSAPVQTPSAPPMETPGAVGLPSPPNFVSRFDPNGANILQQAAGQFFSMVDPRTLPQHYPPSPEDRHAFENAVRDACNRVGGGPEHVENLLSEVIGLGPLDAFLDDETISEIYINSASQIVYTQNGQRVAAERVYSHPEFLFLTATRLTGIPANDPNVPPVEEIRFSDGTKVHIVMPPLAPQGPTLTVRKPTPGFAQLNDLVGAGMMTAAMADLLGHAVDAGRNILVAGASEAARSRLLGALASRIPEGVRTVLLENSGAMNLPQSSVVRLEAGSGQRLAFDMSYLCRAAVKMAPERIILNAISGGEAYEWATLAAGATFGSMAAITGVHAKDALERLEALAQLGGSQGSARAMRSQIARAVHLVAVVHRGPDGKERVHQISEVQGVDFDAYRVSDIFYARTENGQTNFVTTGYVPSFYELLRSSGVNVDTGIFHT